VSSGGLGISDVTYDTDCKEKGCDDARRIELAQDLTVIQ
jgi:hypothetical protein